MFEKDDGWDWEGAFESEKPRRYLLWEKLIWWAVFGSVILVGFLGFSVIVWAIGYTIVRVAALAKGGC